MKQLLFIFFISILVACQKENDSIPTVDYKSFGIEQLTINDTTFTIQPNGILFNSDSSLILSRTSTTVDSTELDYVWTSQTDPLSSVSLTCKNAQIKVTQEKDQSMQKYILTVYNATISQKNIRYVISARLG